jgi:fluoride exporter
MKRDTPAGPGPDPSDLPIDPDLDQTDPADSERRSRWPRIHWWSVAVIGIGGFAGGLARYGIGQAWPTPSGTFPWATFAINTSGAFVLALLLILALEVLPPTTYLRPALGTGFCGAYTTFSSVATASNQLAAHGHVNVAAAYVAISLFAGLAATSLGIVIGRSIAASQAKRTEDSS